MRVEFDTAFDIGDHVSHLAHGPGVVRGLLAIVQVMGTDKGKTVSYVVQFGGKRLTCESDALKASKPNETTVLESLQ